MSLVIEPTLPYPTAALQLEDSNRWARLFPLIRPSVKAVELASGQTVIIDTALAHSKNVLIAAIGSAGNLSSRILSDSHLSAFTTQQGEKPGASAEEIASLLNENGFPIENGLVLVRTGSQQTLRVVSERAVEATVVGELRLDHILSLLLSSNGETKASFEKTSTILEYFMKAAAATTSTFHKDKTGNRPSVIHGVDTAGFESVNTAIEKDLGLLLTPETSLGTNFVYSVHYSDINGLSNLESNILAHEISIYFSQKNLPSYITQSTILNNQSQARGWAISLCAVPATFLTAQPRPSNLLSKATTAAPSTKPKAGAFNIQVPDAQARKVITAGCERLIKDEPTITQYDEIVGDGDCGYTLRDGAKQVLSFVGKADLSNLPSTLSDLVDDLEVTMGGTSGALYCIFISSLAQNLYDAPSFPDALQGALSHLLKYTRARLGDRTCLDCLIPFVETLKETGDAKKALLEAEKGVESTKKLEAKLGRSSYLDEAATRGVPDPGAYGLLKLLEGMVGAS